MYDLKVSTEWGAIQIKIAAIMQRLKEPLYLVNTDPNRFALYDCLFLIFGFDDVHS
jgi:hypothetical protein